MYKNKRYRSRKHISNVQSSVNQSKSVLSPIVENHPPKQRRIEHADPREYVQAQEENNEEDLLGSQEPIPASQPPTQRRYLSQRSTLCRTQSKTMNRAPNSYFEMVLMKAGAELDDPESYILSCDHLTFVNRFRNQLKNHQDFPNNVRTFMEGLEEVIKSHSALVKLLSGCVISIPGVDTTIPSQDSLMLNFLMVEFIQKEIMEILTSKLLELAKDDKHLNSDPPLLPLILSQLKFVAPLHGELLYEKITDIYKCATPRARSEITSQIEYVLSPSHHDAFVEFLMNNIASTDEFLNPQTVQTFTNMYLTTKIQTRIRNKILNYMKNGCQTLLYPTFTKFLLKPDCEDDEVLPILINDLRCSLNFQVEEITDESKKIELDTFSNIKQALTRSKKIFDTWQKVIQKVPARELRSIDFMVLIMLMSIREDRCIYIENLIRRRIKAEHFTVDTIIKVRKELPAVFDQHAEVVLMMLHTFLKEKTHLVSSFAKNCYKIVFIIDDSYQKKILLNLVELACNKSLPDSTTLAIEVLNELNTLYSKEMQNCGLLLLPLLDRISEFSLKQYRMLMELLCLIAYPPPPLNESQLLQDHIDMLVKKQIINRNREIKKQGVIGTVQLINHIIRTEDIGSAESIYDLDASYDTVEQLPDGRAKIAANYIGRIFATTVYCPDTLGLFYDEMAAICSPCNSEKNRKLKPIDRHFLIWFSDLTTNYFQNFFIVEETPSEKSLEMAYEHCINDSEEDASVDSELIPIAVNIGGQCFKPEADSAQSVTILPSMFNLVRTLHFLRYGGNLESINALLGCAVIIPKLPASIADFDIFEEYDDSTARNILNVYFYLINWFRETISAFASQDQQMIRKKILLRLSTLIQLEMEFQHASAKFPADYTRPVVNFIVDSETDKIFKKPIGKPKKATKSKSKSNNNNKTLNENVETEGMSILATTRSQNASGGGVQAKNSKISLNGSEANGIIYRQMDPDIMLLLRERLITSYPMPSDCLGSCIGLLEFKFIMSDLVNKLESVPGIQKLNQRQTLQLINYPADLVKDIVRFLPKIIDHFKQLLEKLKKSVEAVKGAYGNADLFTTELNYTKMCFGYCLHLFAALFSWSGFDDESGKPILKDMLRNLNNYSVFGATPEKSIEELATISLNKFLAIEDAIIDINSAVHLYHVVTSVKRFAKDFDAAMPIRKLCKDFLCRKWYGYAGTMEKGAQCNLLLNELLIGFLADSDYKRMKSVLKLVIEEVNFLKKKDDCLKMFPNIHKANFPMLFRCLCECLINVVRECISEYTAPNLLKKWGQSCELQNMVLEIVKSLDIPRNFTLFLKHAHVFVKAFLQHGLPVFERGLRRDTERANELLKMLQVTTRFLHNLCCHSKAIKNTAIVAQIPALRETIETLVFRVKAALAANNCSAVFFMGNLKNKDLQGDEIRSQTSSLSVSNDGSDDELPDDSTVDESILNEEPARNESRATRSSSGPNTSRSNCF